jgi:hypothetical protein
MQDIANDAPDPGVTAKMARIRWIIRAIRIYSLIGVSPERTQIWLTGQRGEGTPGRV